MRIANKMTNITFGEDMDHFYARPVYKSPYEKLRDAARNNSALNSDEYADRMDWINKCEQCAKEKRIKANNTLSKRFGRLMRSLGVIK